MGAPHPLLFILPFYCSPALSSQRSIYDVRPSVLTVRARLSTHLDLLVDPISDEFRVADSSRPGDLLYGFCFQRRKMYWDCSRSFEYTFGYLFQLILEFREVMMIPELG